MIQSPYLLFLGDAPDIATAKTAAGIRQWRGELCAGQLRLPGCRVDLGLPDLTPREADCLRLVAQGYRDAEIARLSGLAATTVRTHLDNVVRKFGASNRVQAVAIAAQLGLLGALGD